MCCCEERELNDLLGVAGVGALTDAGEYVERVHTEILTLDADVQRAITNDEQPLRPDFNFNEWNSFVNDDISEAIDDDEDFLHPPHGWRVWRSSLSSADFVLNKGEVMATAALFEQKYAEFRDEFKFAGGKPTGGDPPHPGVFETPQEESDEDRAKSRLFTAGIVIAGLVAAGYFLSSAAPLLPRPKR